MSKLLDTENSNVTDEGGFSKASQFKIVGLLIVLILIGVCVYLVVDAIKVGTKAATDSFVTAKGDAVDQVYNTFYDKSFMIAEKKHHVSNEISITLGPLKEKQKIEVLKVSEVNYTEPDEEPEGLTFSTVKNKVTGIVKGKPKLWLEVPGNGVFTVNLQVGEFIIDDDRQYVLIRIPNPELTEFTIDYENVKKLYFEEGGVLKNTAKIGVDEAMKQLQSAELTIMQEVNNNQEFYQRAMQSTEKILVNIVKQLNPQLPDLVVDVEFTDKEIIT